MKFRCKSLAWFPTLTILAFLIACTFMSHSAEVNPGFEVRHNEIVVPRDELFEADCKVWLKKDIDEFHWTFTNTVFSKSDDFGLIWRSEFSSSVSGQSENYTNRVVCWRKEGSTSDDVHIALAFGQRKRLE